MPSQPSRVLVNRTNKIPVSSSNLQTKFKDVRSRDHNEKDDTLSLDQFLVLMKQRRNVKVQSRNEASSTSSSHSAAGDGGDGNDLKQSSSSSSIRLKEPKVVLQTENCDAGPAFSCQQQRDLQNEHPSQACSMSSTSSWVNDSNQLLHQDHHIPENQQQQQHSLLQLERSRLEKLTMDQLRQELSHSLENLIYERGRAAAAGKAFVMISNSHWTK